MTVGRWIGVGFAAALLTAVGCSSGGGDAPPGTIMIACTDGGAAGVNAVTTMCGGVVGTTTEKVNIVMGGPAAGTTTLQGLNFDITYDPTKLHWVSASSTSPLFPGALVVVALANGLQGRVVVGIQMTGGASVNVPPGQHDVLTLNFQRASGVSFAPTPVAFDPAASSPTPTSAPITFTGSLALSYP